QYPVAFGVTENVVHSLEPVQIECQHGERLAAGTRNGIRQPFLKKHAVGQIGERVMTRHVLNLALSRAFFGKIAYSEHLARTSLIFDGMDRKLKNAFIIGKPWSRLNSLGTASTDRKPVSRQQQTIGLDTHQRLFASPHELGEAGVHLDYSAIPYNGQTV